MKPFRLDTCARERGRRLFMLLAMIWLIGGCIPSGRTDPVDIFPEMHYSPAYRAQEPPRLSPPEGAVPVTGLSPRVNPDQARMLINPILPTPENLSRGTDLFAINCRPCHGATGHGDGFVAPYFEEANMPRPVNFASDYTRSLSDGEIFAIIENGLDGMPAWRNLLTDEERWLLVNFIRSVGAQEGAQQGAQEAAPEGR